MKRLHVCLALALVACRAEERSNPADSLERSIEAPPANAFTPEPEPEPEPEPALADDAAPWRNFQKPPADELSEQLSGLQFKVTQQDGTESPFRNDFWDNKQPGLYVDVVSGEPLFSSLDKFDSGTGWPSFTQPVVSANVVEDYDTKLGYPRTEVRSKHADSHLGHVFPDGPDPTGLRYCINSASLRFVPVAELENAGYAAFAELFTPPKIDLAQNEKVR